MKKMTLLLVVFISVLVVIPVYISQELQFFDEIIKDSHDDDDCVPLIHLPDGEISMQSWELPDEDPPWEAAFKINLSGFNVEEIDGYYDVNTRTYYKGWCVEFGIPSPEAEIGVTLYSSYDEDLPDYLAHENWDKVNYILNNKQGDRYDVQRAIWYFVNFGHWDYDDTDNYSPPMKGHVAQATYDMMQAANESGDDWCPRPGQVIAVILDQGADRTKQLSFIEVTIPGGASPGFWKNKGVQIGWPEPYHVDMTLEDAGFVIPGGSMTDFPMAPVYSDDTLLEALNYKGGGGLSGMAHILLRAAVAAVLNAAHDEISYPLAVNELLDSVNDALETDRDTMEDLATNLDYYNNLGFEEWW